MILRALTFWTDWFVVWVVLFSATAYVLPELFMPLRSLIVPGLGVIMFGMGMTLLPADFLRVGRMPRAVACGILGQFVIMPLLAFTLAVVFRLDSEVAMGFIILGACPGGTASNVIAFLAKADVALSVTMTACSTLLAIPLTPIIVKLLGGHYLPVDAWAMFLSMVKIVLVPVTGGIVMRWILKEKAGKALAAFPALSVFVIVVIIAAIVAGSREKLQEVIGVVGVIVVLHNVMGLALGYGLAAVFRLPKDARRTVAIEVGMQNSDLGVALAGSYSQSALVALPASLFSVVHNLTGSILANLWRRREEAPSPDEETGHPALHS